MNNRKMIIDKQYIKSGIVEYRKNSPVIPAGCFFYCKVGEYS